MPKPSRKAEASVEGSGAPPAPKLPFEQALEQLEQVVETLEGGDLELETSLESFEKGVRLTRQCAGQLEAAESRIEILMREGGRWLARPFEGGGEAGDEAGDEGEGDEAEPLEDEE